jgi:hypothetical protein
MVTKQEKLLHSNHSSEGERDLDMRPQSNELINEEIRRLRKMNDQLLEELADVRIDASNLRIEVNLLLEEIERLQNIV